MLCLLKLCKNYSSYYSKFNLNDVVVNNYTPFMDLGFSQDQVTFFFIWNGILLDNPFIFAIDNVLQVHINVLNCKQIHCKINGT